jgi:hypothetical protein
MRAGVAVTISYLQATDVPTNIGSRRSITGTRRIGVVPDRGRARAMTNALVVAPVTPCLLPDARQVDAREQVLSEAHAVLALHRADAGGFCSGCLDLARLAPVPCPRRLTALFAVETHGVARWNTPARHVEVFAPTGGNAGLTSALGLSAAACSSSLPLCLPHGRDGG